MGWGELYAVSHSVDLCWTVTDWFHTVFLFVEQRQQSGTRTLGVRWKT